MNERLLVPDSAFRMFGCVSLWLFLTTSKCWQDVQHVLCYQNMRCVKACRRLFCARVCARIFELYGALLQSVIKPVCPKLCGYAFCSHVRVSGCIRKQTYLNICWMCGDQNMWEFVRGHGFNLIWRHSSTCDSSKVETQDWYLWLWAQNQGYSVARAQ